MDELIGGPMRVQHVPIDAADPVQVYRLVREHLRGDVAAARAAAALHPQPEGGAGLSGLRGAAPRRRRSARGAAAHARTRETKGGVYFRDTFRNGYIEDYWARRAPQGSDLLETNTIDDFVGIYTDGAGSPGFIKNLLMTQSEVYPDVRCEAWYYMPSPLDPAVVVARGESNGTDLLSGYVVSYYPAAGAIDLSQVSGGIETIQATITGVGTLPVFGLWIACHGNQVSGGLVGGPTVGPVTLALHTSGRIGFGSRNGGVEWIVTSFAATAP